MVSRVQLGRRTPTMLPNSAPRRQNAFGCRAKGLRLVRYSYFGTYATLPPMREMSVTEQRYKAVLAVVADSHRQQPRLQLVRDPAAKNYRGARNVVLHCQLRLIRSAHEHNKAFRVGRLIGLAFDGAAKGSV